jgi:ubiquinone/menaquinone biosynthesis C-methylase UbiE
MTSLTTETLEQLRQHFNKAPYPSVPLEKYPDDPDRAYSHSLVTAFYRRDRRVVQPEGRIILDAGCGTGYKSMELALANPGAKIIGIDISEESVVMARQRLDYHKIGNCEFRALPLENLGELGMDFDYINCDDVLYFVPDPVMALQSMRSVLKPEGLLRINYHSIHGRKNYLIAQDFFRQLGCMQGTPDEAEIALVRQTMQAMKPNVLLRKAWIEPYLKDDELILANYLLQNDKSWSVNQFFAAMQSAGLEYISMLDWWTWNLADLFDIDELPLDVAMALSDLSTEEQLAMFDAIQPIHRLLDLWCGHPRPAAQEPTPVEEWSEQQWFEAMVHFHPQLLTEQFKTDLIDCTKTGKMLNTSPYLRTTTLNTEGLMIDTLMVGCLLPLLEGERRFQDLLHRRMHLHPINATTMEPTTTEQAFEPLRQILTRLEEMGYVLLATP